MPTARKTDPLAVSKFDPAPHDKYAADPKQAAPADLASHSTLSIGLILSFPASDPISAIQPALPSRADR